MGNFRETPLKTKHFDRANNNRFDVVATGMCGWRKYMQDSHICNIDIGNGNSLFAVFDGHGGPQVSDQVSRILVDYLIKNQNYASKNYKEALIETFQNVDRWMMSNEGQAEIKKRREQNRARENASTEDQSDAGCTAVVCLVTSDQVYVANAGDSRCFLGSGTRAIDMSEDHKPDNKEQNARITAAGGEVMDGRVNGNLNLSRALGDFQYKNNTSRAFDQQLIISKPDVTVKPLQGVEYIVLGCDGLFEVKSNQEIYDLVLSKKNEGLEATVTYILDSLLASDTQGSYGLDNMTMVVARLR